MIVFLSGLPGAGKSTAGLKVAHHLGWNFVEADQFLTEEMKAQISEGILLSQEQLSTWVIDALIPHLVKLEKEGPLVVAGMLGEKIFVDTLTQQASKVVYINIDVPYETLKERVESRDHFAGVAMLNKCWQLREQLILPGETVDGSEDLENVVEAIIEISQREIY